MNRKYLVALKSITDVVAYSNSRLKLKVQNANEDDFLVAREKVKVFKNWLEGES
ncbi:MAG: LytTR family transcriptional regulator DNA-binding domain-containing protein [Bacteroidota bacterium]